jgi:hypothetical protein
MFEQTQSSSAYGIIKYMTLQTFKDLLGRRPFEPFRVILSSGQAYDVRHPEMAWLTRTTLYVGTNTAPEGVPEEAVMCSLLHIASVEPANHAHGR